MEEEIWLDLLNSDWHDYRGTGKHEDRLDDPQWVKEFFKRWAIDLNAISEEKVRASLRALRAVISRIAKQAAAGKKLGPKALEGLNPVFVHSPLTRRLDLETGRLQIMLVPVAGKLESALGEIAGSFAEALARGAPSRIKICKNKDCFWVFYDRSKNKSRKWCEGATCGNLMKVRRFREKHRKSQT